MKRFARDSEGRVVGVCVQQLERISSPRIAKVLAIRLALISAKECGFTGIQHTNVLRMLFLLGFLVYGLDNTFHGEWNYCRNIGLWMIPMKMLDLTSFFFN
ncbi:unnamed protein product [Camellia sinensis]